MSGVHCSISGLKPTVHRERSSSRLATWCKVTGAMLDCTFKTERELLPKFSVPRRAVNRDLHRSRNRDPGPGLSNRGQVQLQATTDIHTKEGDRAVEHTEEADDEVKDVDEAPFHGYTHA